MLPFYKYFKYSRIEETPENFVQASKKELTHIVRFLPFFKYIHKYSISKNVLIVANYIFKAGDAEKLEI